MFLLQTHQPFLKPALTVCILIASPRRESPRGSVRLSELCRLWRRQTKKSVYPRQNVSSLQNQLNAHLLNCSHNVRPHTSRAQTGLFAGILHGTWRPFPPHSHTGREFNNLCLQRGIPSRLICSHSLPESLDSFIRCHFDQSLNVAPINDQLVVKWMSKGNDNN